MNGRIRKNLGYMVSIVGLFFICEAIIAGENAFNSYFCGLRAQVIGCGYIFFSGIYLSYFYSPRNSSNHDIYKSTFTCSILLFSFLLAIGFADISIGLLIWKGRITVKYLDYANFWLLVGFSEFLFALLGGCLVFIIKRFYNSLQSRNK